MRAYDDYFRGRVKYETKFYREVLKFARMKLYHLEHDFAEMGSADTVDDWAQEVVVKVWQTVDKFEGDAEAFYSWVHKICFNHATDCFNDLKKQQDTMEPLVTKGQDKEAHYSYARDNPALNPVVNGFDGPSRVDEIVSALEGVDKWICKLILDGNSQKQVAALLHMTLKAVEHRLEGMRTRFMKGKENQIA